MENVEKFIISKEDFKKYFNNKNEVDKKIYFEYLEEKNLTTLLTTLFIENV